MEYRTGWISPTGEFVECDSYSHISTAREIAEKLHLGQQYDTKRARWLSDDEKLMNAGWVYVGISSFMGREWRIGWRSRLTSEQVRFLRPYIEDGGGIPVNNVAAMRWEEEGY